MLSMYVYVFDLDEVTIVTPSEIVIEALNLHDCICELFALSTTKIRHVLTSLSCAQSALSPCNACTPFVTPLTNDENVRRPLKPIKTVKARSHTL